MEQELRFGLDLGQFALLEKNHIWADYEQLFTLGKKMKNTNIIASAKVIYTKYSKH